MNCNKCPVSSINHNKKTGPQSIHTNPSTQGAHLASNAWNAATPTQAEDLHISSLLKMTKLKILSNICSPNPLPTHTHTHYQTWQRVYPTQLPRLPWQNARRSKSIPALKLHWRIMHDKQWVVDGIVVVVYRRPRFRVIAYMMYALPGCILVSIGAVYGVCMQTSVPGWTSMKYAYVIFHPVSSLQGSSIYWCYYYGMWCFWCFVLLWGRVCRFSGATNYYNWGTQICSHVNFCFMWKLRMGGDAVSHAQYTYRICVLRMGYSAWGWHMYIASMSSMQECALPYQNLPNCVQWYCCC